MDSSGFSSGSTVKVGCKDGSMHDAELVYLPFYDELAEIPRGKRIDFPER
jgi:hypothetical protein